MRHLRSSTRDLIRHAFDRPLQAPGGESYVRLDTPVAGKGVVLVCGLHQADEKALPLLSAAAAAREFGAGRIVSSNTIAHFTNSIDINGVIASEVAELNA